MLTYIIRGTLWCRTCVCVCSFSPLRSPASLFRLYMVEAHLFCSYSSSDCLLLLLMPSWVATWLLEPWPLAEPSSLSIGFEQPTLTHCRFGFLRSNRVTIIDFSLFTKAKSSVIAALRKKQLIFKLCYCFQFVASSRKQNPQ